MYISYSIHYVYKWQYTLHSLILLLFSAQDIVSYYQSWKLEKKIKLRKPNMILYLLSIMSKDGVSLFTGLM